MKLFTAYIVQTGEEVCIVARSFEHASEVFVTFWLARMAMGSQGSSKRRKPWHSQLYAGLDTMAWPLQRITPKSRSVAIK